MQKRASSRRSRAGAVIPATVMLAAAASAAGGPGQAGREVISTPGAPGAIGPYSQAIRVGDTLYTSGQIGMDPVTGVLVAGGIEAETRQVLANLKAVFEAAGFSLSDAVQAQVFLADFNDFAAMNAVYAEFFPQAPPARATVQVARLPRDARVEIMLVAQRSAAGDTPK